jgi:gliding motility-associated-like protein
LKNINNGLLQFTQRAFTVFVFLFSVLLNNYKLNAQTLNLGNDTIICNLAPFSLNAGPGWASYLWHNNSTGQTITANTSGLYWVEVTDANANVFRDSIRVTKSAPPVAHFNYNDTCKHAPITFSDASNWLNDPPQRWFWNFGTGDTASTTNPSITHTFDTAGTFLVTMLVYNEYDCSSTKSLPVTIFPLPVVFAGADQYVNRGDTFIIQAAASDAAYLWQPNFFLNFDTILQPRCIPNTTITYTLTATDTNGCVSTDTITIFVNQRPVASDKVFSINPNSTLRISSNTLATDPENNPLTIIILSGPYYGTAAVQGDTIVYTPDIHYSGNDTIVYVVCDNGNPPLCDQGILIINIANMRPDAQNDFFETEINTRVAFNVMVNDTEYNLNQTVVIKEIGSPANGSVVDNNFGNLVYTPYFNFLGTDSFFYEICDDGQPILCDTGWVFIKVNTIPLFIHNSFSPNGDGVFDYFVIEGIKSFPDSELSIFNRWGEIVFKATGYDNNWDGFTGFKEELPQATYFYHLDLKDGSKPLTGYIVLKR